MHTTAPDDADDWQAEGRRVLSEAARALDTLAARLDKDAWQAAVRLILDTPGRVVVTGMGKSGNVGRKLAGTLASTGTRAFFLHPAEGVHGDLGMLAPEDVVVALSYSGETDEIMAILPTLHRLGVPIVALTGNGRSTLAQAARVVLNVAVDREAWENLAPTTSTTAMIAMGDALAVTVMLARQFTPDDYARLHPAGTLGRRLTLRVSDIMRTGEAVALVPDTAVLRDAVLAITRAHAGAAIVTDARERVCGLVAESDVRRHLLDPGDPLALPLPSVMNPRPGVVTPDLLAVEGLRCLGTFHPIPGEFAGEAPVVDSEGRPVGMLTLKDLVKAGIG